MTCISDPERLAALAESGLPDSPAEERFDRLTRIAAAALHAPVSLISLVDERRQFFKSAVGLQDPWAAARQTPLSHSFCQHVVETDKPFRVCDAPADPRVGGNRAIPDLGVTAYLGVPLTDGSGHTLGALCVIDNAARDWSPADLAILKDIAGLVQCELDEHFTTRALKAQVQEHKKLMAELVRARDAAEAAQRAKAQFLAIISHELRTPLNGVIGLSGMLLDGVLDEQSRLHAKMLHEAADHLLALINDLLDFSRLEADRLEFEELPYSVETTVQSALDLLAGRAHAKGLEIGAFVAPDVPPMLIGDAGRLRQVLLNLLGNAVKFTSSGNVMLDVSFRGTDGGRCAVEFTVSDTGPGIPAHAIPALFAEFSQVESGSSRSADGTGLGLAICRRLVGRMGGEISVESTVGLGSTFRFTIRQPVAHAAPGSTARMRAMLAGERILVLHAGAAGGDLLCRQIGSRGGDVRRATFGAAALRQLRLAVEDAEPFHACIVDGDLPEEGAETFARAARADSRFAQIRLILLTDGGSPGHEAGAAGLFDCVLVKPVPTDTLIYRLRGDVRCMDAKPALPQAPAFAGLRILVAEDNNTNQAVLRAMLGKLGYRADIVGNGLEAVQAVMERPYDVVLMDVMMPEMDGVAATARIRGLGGRAGQIPIVALTADAAEQNHIRYRAAGMTAVLTKPLTLPALSDALLRLQDAAMPAA